MFFDRVFKKRSSLAKSFFVTSNTCIFFVDMMLVTGNIIGWGSAVKITAAMVAKLGTAGFLGVTVGPCAMVCLGMWATADSAKQENQEQCELVLEAATRCDEAYQYAKQKGLLLKA